MIIPKEKICIKKSHIFLLFVLFLIIYVFYFVQKLNREKHTYSTEAAPPLIIGGQPADRGEWPFMVALFNKRGFGLKTVSRSGVKMQTILSDDKDIESYKACNLEKKYSNTQNSGTKSTSVSHQCPSNIYYRFFCAGVLVDKSWVVTAAHCLQGLSTRDFSIAGGIYNLKYDYIDDKNIIIKDPDIIISRREYESNIIMFGFDSKDIALIHLKEPMNLPTISMTKDKNFLKRDYEAYMLGWGFTQEYKDPQISIEQLKVLPSRILKEARVRIDRTESTKNKIISVLTGNTSCQGDSGGPLIIWDEDKKKYYLLGIIQMVNIDQKKRDEESIIKCISPTQMTSIPYSYNWIELKTRPYIYLRGIQPDTGSFMGEASK